jgi:hypothetical protein
VRDNIDLMIGSQAACIAIQHKKQVIEILRSDEDDERIWERLRMFFSSTSADNILANRYDILVWLSRRASK